ncbi:sodium/potassium-transporting ATPase subunit gamma-like [Protopterus annectens]|uniref:sodium/potassium-transporting ATPase subunit gamma-like n=1 Tax=Protopterus annectens TaxID=7888 RepID=UPI001CFA1FB6|nr:sodium/potassium-transporting ATPase subunit gamma-like [Protopterus annectens]
MATEAPKGGHLSGNEDPFYYDYDTVRMTGMILAVAMFIFGILVALSNKFKCKKSSPNGNRPGERQQINSQGPPQSI